MTRLTTATLMLCFALAGCGGGGGGSGIDGGTDPTDPDPTPPTAHVDRFQIVDEETAIDNLRGKHWDRYPSDDKMTWEQADAYCSGYGWRIPTKEELWGLEDQEADWLSALDSGIFDFEVYDPRARTMLWADIPPLRNSEGQIVGTDSMKYLHAERVMSGHQWGGFPTMRVVCIQDPLLPGESDPPKPMPDDYALIADAGPDQTIMLNKISGANTIIRVDGGASYDEAGQPLKGWFWRELSGASGQDGGDRFANSPPTYAFAVRETGFYVFQLEIYGDNSYPLYDDRRGSDTVSVTVVPYAESGI